MKIRATLLSFTKLAVVVTVAGACAAPRNKVMADTPVLPYQPPDIAEITGIEEPDEDAEEQEAPAPAPPTEHKTEAAPAPAPAPATPAKPAAPAKTPAKPAPGPKTPAPAPADKK